MVTGRDPGDSGTHLLDHTCAFVPEHHRQPTGDLALDDVQIRVAQPRVREPDEDFALLWAAELELLDLERLAVSCTTAAVVFTRGILVAPRLFRRLLYNPSSIEEH